MTALLAACNAPPSPSTSFAQTEGDESDVKVGQISIKPASNQLGDKNSICVDGSIGVIGTTEPDNLHRPCLLRGLDRRLKFY